MSEKIHTPETDAEWEVLCCSGQPWYRIAENLRLVCRRMERERDDAEKRWKSDNLYFAAAFQLLKEAGIAPGSKELIAAGHRYEESQENPGADAESAEYPL